MARTWKAMAVVVAWMGLGGVVRAQFAPGPGMPPPPTPINGPVMMGPGMAPPAMPMNGPFMPAPTFMPGAPPGAYGPSGPMPIAPATTPAEASGGRPFRLMNLFKGGDPSDGGEPPGIESKYLGGNAFGGEDSGPGNYLRHQFQIDYLLLWFRGIRVPPLVTEGSANDPVVGALGQPGTTILNGGDHFSPGSSSALRVKWVYWIADPEVLSIDTSFIIMEQRSVLFNAASDASGNPPLSRPFFNTDAQQEDADPRSLPFTRAGTVHDSLRTRLMSAESVLKWNVTGGGDYGFGLHLCVGPKWIQLHERYQNYDTTFDIPFGSGTATTFTDTFTTYNNFFGGTMGAALRWKWDRCTIEVPVRLGLGENSQTLRIAGSTTQTDFVNGTTIVDNTQATFARPSNIGNFLRDVFGVVPEVGVNVGISITDNLKFNVGYGMFYMNSVLRPGTAIDRMITPTALGDPTIRDFPRVLLDNTTFWAQWVNFGLELAF